MKLMIKLSSKKQKKYGDIYLNKLFEVSINHLNKSPVILIHIIWFLEEVYKKKSVTLRTLVYDFLKVRKNQQMSPHRVGLFLLLPLISFHCGITMCVFTAEYITVVSLWQKIAFQGVLRQQRCHAKSTLRISSLVSDQILLMDGFSSLQQWASKSEELLRVSREIVGNPRSPGLMEVYFMEIFQNIRKSTWCLLLFIPGTTPTTKHWLLLLFCVLHFG